MLKPRLEGYVDIHRGDIQVAKQQLQQRVCFMYFMLSNFFLQPFKENHFVISANAYSALMLLVGHQEWHSACKKLSGVMLAWLCVWVKVHICIWPSWCQCHSLSLAPVNPVLFYFPGFWPTVLSVEPLVQCLVCLSSVRRPSSVTFLADRTIGRAYGTVCRLSVVRRPSSVRL